MFTLQPHMISTLHTAFSAAVDQIDQALVLLRQSGHLVAAHYTQQAMEGPASSYQALVAYHRELNTVHDTLQRMEDEYRRRDHDASTDLGRRA